MHIRVNSCPRFMVARYKLRQAIIKSLHTILKKQIAYALIYTGIILRIFGKNHYGLNLILKGRRVDDIAIANNIIRTIIQKSSRYKSEFDPLLVADLTQPIERLETRMLILKLPVITEHKVTEKGAIIFKFSEAFAPMYLSLDLNLLTKYFRIILEPSSVGYSIPEILVWSNLYAEKIVVLSPHVNDFVLLTNTTTNLVPLKLGPADWVDTSKFYKISEANKIYDAIYVANFNPIKRVERYIQAIVRINRDKPNYKAALVCAGFGAAKREVLATLECARMKHASIDFFPALKQADINELFNKSKVNILISLREGANKGLAEGLFSGTPALLIKENVGGNHLHINDQTGQVVPDAELENALIWFSENYDKFTPREWAMKHISPVASTHVLSKKLQEIEASEGRLWTTDIFTKVNKPELNYLYENDFWLLAERVKLLSNFSSGADELSIIHFLEGLQKKAACQLVNL